MTSHRSWSASTISARIAPPGTPSSHTDDRPTAWPDGAGRLSHATTGPAAGFPLPAAARSVPQPNEYGMEHLDSGVEDIDYDFEDIVIRRARLYRNRVIDAYPILVT